MILITTWTGHDARIFQIQRKVNCKNVALSKYLVTDDDFKIFRKLSDEDIIKSVTVTEPENRTNSEGKKIIFNQTKPSKDKERKCLVEIEDWLKTKK